MKILLASNLYPSKDAPTLGVFVKNFCNELDELDINYEKVVINMRSGKIGKLFSYLSYFVRFLFKGLFSSYDVLYIHYASHNAIVALIIKFFRRDKKIFVNVHGSDVLPQTNTQKRMQKYVRRLLTESEKIIVPSEYFKNLIAQKFNENIDKFYVYPSGGIDNEVFYPREIKDEFYQKYGIEKNRRYIGYVSRIAKGKGWDTFLEGLKHLREDQEYEDVKGIVVGLGEEVNEFKEYVNTLDLNDIILYIPQMPQEELCSLYNLIEVFVFPTKRESESLGLVGIEAMATATPTIASDFAAPKYIITEGYDGYKFIVNDSLDLSKKLKMYFNQSSKEKETMGNNAYNTSKNYFSQNVREKLRNILTK